MSLISNTDLNEAIYKKYICPTQRKRKPYVGVEFELPIVNFEKKPVDFSLIHRLTDAFIRQFSFDILHRDDNGNIYSAQSSVNNDGISYDCSYNTLELSFGAEADLNVLYQRFTVYYEFIQDFLKRHNHTLTGMGINPYHKFNRNEPIPNGRYRMLYHHLCSYEKYGQAIPFHNNPNFGLFSCASQVQLDVEENMLAETLNTFTKLEPLKSLLFANSLWGEKHECLCVRDMFWKNSLHGLNRHNVDMYEISFHDSEEIVAYIKSMSLYCVERGEKYINFPPVPLKKYFESEQIVGEYYDKGNYHEIHFEPQIEDLAYLRSFKFEDLTFRGTVEFRSVCEQPVREIMTPSAFHTGLMENLSSFTSLLNSNSTVYRRGYSPLELRNLLNRREFPEFLDKAEVSALLIEILDIARDGLIKRGLHEEHFLEPLYRRAKKLSNPARQIANGLDNNVPLEYFIHEYAKL